MLSIHVEPRLAPNERARTWGTVALKTGGSVSQTKEIPAQAELERGTRLEILIGPNVPIPDT
jgi:hypothetical protein